MLEPRRAHDGARALGDRQRHRDDRVHAVRRPDRGDHRRLRPSTASGPLDDVRSMVFWLAVTAIVGTLLSQLLLYPGGVLIAAVAHVFVHRSYAGGTSVRQSCVGSGRCGAARTTTGCASSISSWIVQTRNHQGDVALDHGNSADASVAYQLALRVDPSNAHARAGLVARASAHRADAVHRVAVRGRGAGARCRQPLRSGRPAHRSAARADRTGRGQARHRRFELPVVPRNGCRSADVRSFSCADKRRRSRRRCTASTTPTTAASSRRRSRQSYELNSQVTRLTDRLMQYRQLVDSGVPESADTAIAPPASLLPLP